MHLSETAKPINSLGGRQVSAELEAVVAKAISKAPADRFQTMSALAEALLACPEGAGISRRSMLPSMPDQMGSSPTISVPPPAMGGAAGGSSATHVRAQTASGQELSTSVAPPSTSGGKGKLFIGLGAGAALLATVGYLAVRPPPAPLITGSPNVPTAPAAVSSAPVPADPPASAATATTSAAPTIAPVLADGKIKVQIAPRRTCAAAIARMRACRCSPAPSRSPPRATAC